MGGRSAGIEKSISGSEEPLDVESRFSEEAQRSEPQALTLRSRMGKYHPEQVLFVYVLNDTYNAKFTLNSLEISRAIIYFLFLTEL